MNYRTIERVVKDRPAHWVGNGFRVKQMFPAGQPEGFYERFSPFILLDYNEPYFFEASPFETGVGPHPHQGFETVTFALAGKVEHGDNQGNHGVIETGDLQWMTAGKGILHKEYHETEFSKKDRILHMIQLWVDLPQEHKLTSPKYQAITKRQMGRYQSFDQDLELTVYAGETHGVKGPASTFSPMNIYKVDIGKDRLEEFLEPSGYNTGLLILSGEVEVNGELTAKSGHFVLFENDELPFALRGLTDMAEVFVLSGQPLNQPVVHTGPFVMTTREEIRQASQDFQSGKFGDINF